MTGAATREVVVLNWRDRQHGSAGGAELYCERLARELVRRGRSVVLVTSRPPGAARRETVDGFRIRRLGGWWSVYPLALLWLLRHRASVAAVVDSQNGIPFFSPLVVGRRVPVLLLVHHVHQDLFTQALRPAAARLARWLEGPMSRRVYRGRTVVVRSPASRTQVRRRLRFDGPIRVVPCGAETRDHRVARSAVPRIVVVGRLTRYKQLGALVDAMAKVRRRIPDAELHLVGDGPVRQELAERARRNGVPVVLHGRLPDAERDDLIGSAWLTVSTPDGGDWDPSLVEANAAGVPALVPRRDGARDIVWDGQTGWHVGDSPQDLAAALVGALTTLADPVTASVVAQRARAWAARFTWQRTADGVLDALESERARLRRRWAGSGERRTGNDLTVALQVPRSALPDGWQASRRTGDVWVAERDTVRCLLVGADERDALVVLDRLGIDRTDPAVSVLVARLTDLLGDRHLAGRQRIDLLRPSGAAPAAYDHDDRGDRHAA